MSCVHVMWVNEGKVCVAHGQSKVACVSICELRAWDIGRVFVYLSFECAQTVETGFTSHGSESCVGHIDRVVN